MAESTGLTGQGWQETDFTCCSTSNSREIKCHGHECLRIGVGQTKQCGRRTTTFSLSQFSDTKAHICSHGN